VKRIGGRVVNSKAVLPIPFQLPRFPRVIDPSWKEGYLWADHFLLDQDKGSTGSPTVYQLRTLSLSKGSIKESTEKATLTDSLLARRVGDR